MEYELNKKVKELFIKYKYIDLVAYLVNMNRIDVLKILRKEKYKC